MIIPLALGAIAALGIIAGFVREVVELRQAPASRLRPDRGRDAGTHRSGGRHRR